MSVVVANVSSAISFHPFFFSEQCRETSLLFRVTIFKLEEQSRDRCVRTYIRRSTKRETSFEHTHACQKFTCNLLVPRMFHFLSSSIPIFSSPLQMHKRSFPLLVQFLFFFSFFGATTNSLLFSQPPSPSLSTPCLIPLYDYNRFGVSVSCRVSIGTRNNETETLAAVSSSLVSRDPLFFSFTRFFFFLFFFFFLQQRYNAVW